MAAARRRAGRPQALTAGPSFQAPAAGSGPCGSGAERGAPTAPVLHFTAQSRQGPHHCGLCAGRDLPGQPPAGAESRGGESSPVPPCADACAGAGASSVPWPQGPCRAPGISALLWGCTGKALAQRGDGTVGFLPRSRDTWQRPGADPGSWLSLQGSAQHQWGLLCCWAEQPPSCVPAAPAHGPRGRSIGCAGREPLTARARAPPPPAPPHQPGGTLMRLSPQKQTVSLPCRHVIISLSK